MKRLSVAVVLVVSLAAGSANAVPVTITATGKVVDIQDPSGFFGLAPGIDATITQVYRFDTNDIPTTDSNATSDIALYQDLSDWLSATTIIATSSNDIVIQPSIVSAPDTFHDYFLLEDESAAPSGLEQVFFADVDRDTSVETIYQYLIFSDANTSVDVITSLDAIAGLDLLDPSLWERARGYVEYQTVSGVSTAIYSISSVGVAYTSVPEPSALALLGAGFFGLGLTRRRGARSRC